MTTSSPNRHRSDISADTVLPSDFAGLLRPPLRLLLAIFLVSIALSVMTRAQVPGEKDSPSGSTQGAGIAPAVLGGTWQPIGPAPKRNGQSEGARPNNGVNGAVHAIAPHPTDPNILYVGTVNGGIWKSTNATALRPAWVQQTDPQTSLSIGALEFDPADANRQTLYAGIGRFSSFGRAGGRRLGLLRTVDGGNRWTIVDGGGTIAGKNICGVAPRGRIIV